MARPAEGRLTVRALVLTAALALLAPTTEASRPRAPKVQVVVSRDAYNPMLYRATALAQDPDRVIACPGHVWFWGDEDGAGPGTQQGDCDPDIRPEDRPTSRSMTREHEYKRAFREGVTITVVLVDLGTPSHPFWKGERTVFILGMPWMD